MENLLLDYSLTRPRAETAIRWVAMGIAAIPSQERLPQYALARRGIEKTVARCGLAGAEARVAKSMAALHMLVRELELRRKSFAPAGAALALAPQGPMRCG
jgi:hypothetical protein